jgi:hypothetical protein
MEQSNISRKAIVLGLICALIVGVVGYLVYAGIIVIDLPKTDGVPNAELSEAAFAADIEKLKDIEPNFAPIRAFFVTMAQEKGGVYAFEVLKRAPLPPNTDLHLLGHAVGDELYKQQKFEGMKHCTHDFRNACSHSIVVGALLEKGLAVFDDVNAVCKTAPGGPGAYTMCFHGFGHGVLAYTDYEVPEAVELCKRTGTAEFNFEEESQCIGGIVMEMYGGINDPATWEEKKDKFLSAEDPLKMCKADYMPDSAKILCYSYVTPFIFDAAGAVNGNPRPEIYAKSFSFCDEVENDAHRRSCYGGLGKEFVVLAQDRDIRKMEDTPTDKLKLAASWCMLAEKTEAQNACMLSILDSLYWGGENDPEVSIRYCSNLEVATAQDACFDHLFGITTYYQPDPKKREAICAAVPSGYTAMCEDILLEQ